MKQNLKQALVRYKKGSLPLGMLLEQLRELPFQDLSFAKVDLHRSLRRRFPEVIYGQGKSVAQIISVADALHQAGDPVVITKVNLRMAKGIKKRLPWIRYFPEARIAAGAPRKLTPSPRYRRGCVLIVTAGTTDIPEAEEAAVTLQLMGIPIKRLFDVGVAGLPRLLKNLRPLWKARVIIVIAGMDGALPSVVSGLVGRPVVAVPTSVGYGASFKGLSALLAMLNSCSPGVAVVNIDNGFGAGYLAAMIAGVT